MLSPFEGTTNVSYGIVDGNRTSDLSIHYPSGMLITPWPILITSTGISLVLGLIGYISAAVGAKRFERGNPPNPGGIRMVLPLAGLFITTIRTISFIVVAIRRNHLTSLPPASSMILFLVSILPNINNLMLPMWATILAAVDYISSSIAMANILLAKKRYHYGQLEVSGGYCPSVSNVSCSQFTSVTQAGCLPNMTQTDNGLPVSIHALYVTEEFMRILGMLYGAIVLVIIVAMLLGKILQLFSDKVPERDFQKQQWEWVKVFSRVSLILAIILIVIVVPEHAVAETSTASYSILDSFGPLLPVNGSHGTSNGTSWTDCFDLRPPVDRLGFIDYWWDNKASAALHVLAWM